MTALAIKPLTQTEIGIAEDIIRAHLNNLLADAREQNRDRTSLEIEACRWIDERAVTPRRADEIVRCARDDERDIVARYLGGGLR